jgi:hypothetical protein
VGTKKDAKPNTAVQKAVECVAEDLDVYMQHDEVCQYGDPELSAIASLPACMEREFDYGLRTVHYSCPSYRTL